MFIEEKDFAIRPYSIPALNADTRPSFEFIISEERQHYWVKRLLGLSLGQAFIDASPSGEVTEPRFLTLFEELNFSISNQPFFFEGLKRLLVAIFYREWMHELHNIALHTGSSRVESIAASESIAELATTWNHAVTQHDTLMHYVHEESETYPEFDYVEPLRYQAAI